MFIGLTNKKTGRPLSVNLDNVNKIEVPAHTNDETILIFVDGSFQFVTEKYDEVMEMVKKRKTCGKGILR